MNKSKTDLIPVWLMLCTLSTEAIMNGTKSLICHQRYIYTSDQQFQRLSKKNKWLLQTSPFCYNKNSTILSHMVQNLTDMSEVKSRPNLKNKIKSRQNALP